MKFFTVLAAFGALASASSVNARQAGDLKECCYVYKPNGNTQIFRSTALSQRMYGEPGKWCEAEIKRDESDPDNCAKGAGKITAGYCVIGEDFNEVVDCP